MIQWKVRVDFLRGDFGDFLRHRRKSSASCLDVFLLVMFDFLPPLGEYVLPFLRLLSKFKHRRDESAAS